MSEQDAQHLLNAQLETELHRLQKIRGSLLKEIDTTKETITEYKKELGSYKTSKGNLSMEYERFATRKQGFFWWMIIFSCCILKYLTFSAGLYLVCFFLEFAFLINWRSLYMKRVNYAKPLAILIVSFTIYIIL